MKAITTKYHGPTDTRPSRISASDEDGNRVLVPYDHGFSGTTERQHAEAARALCQKMGWSGILHGGSIKGGYVFVFDNTWETYQIEVRDAAAAERFFDDKGL